MDEEYIGTITYSATDTNETVDTSYIDSNPSYMDDGTMKIIMKLF